MSDWSIHPSIPIGLGLLVCLYAAGVGPLRRRFGWGPPVPWEQVAAFATAILILFLALTGPIHDLSDSYLFSVHMVQHLVLTLIVPPLLLVGTPDGLVRALLRRRPLGAVAHTLGWPPLAFLIFNGALAIWHLPPLYNSTLMRVDIHIFEHLIFLAAAVVGWWPILAPAMEYRASMVVQLVYLLLVAFPMKLVGLMILLSDTILYPVYAIAPSVWGLDPMQDQQIGGLLMLIPGGIIFFVALGAHFFRWYAESERLAQPGTNVVHLSRERLL